MVKRRARRKVQKWSVQVLGQASAPFEISIVRARRITEAQRQYGWFDENKLLVSHSGGPRDDKVDNPTWDLLLAVAVIRANQLNAETSK